MSDDVVANRGSVWVDVKLNGFTDEVISNQSIRLLLAFSCDQRFFEVLHSVQIGSSSPNSRNTFSALWQGIDNELLLSRRSNQSTYDITPGHISEGLRETVCKNTRG